jgi:ketosteroid isomerase-like protein
MKKLTLAALAPTLLLAACGSGDPAEAIDAVRHTELAQLDSIASKDLVGIARLYRDDARLVKPDGEVLEGGVAIVEEYGVLLEDPNFSLTIEPTQAWASGDGEYTIVNSLVQFTTTDPATGEAVTLPLDSQTVWHRETGATWKIVSAYNVARPTAPTDEAAAEAAE